MSTPTPRTDAAWASSFEECEYRAAHTARTMRECSQQLETELAALAAECDQLRADRTYNHECINRLATATGTLGEKSEKVVEVALSTIAELRSEVERLNALGSWAHTCIHHTDEERKAWVACPCCAIARAERAEAEVKRLGHLEAVLRSCAFDKDGTAWKTVCGWWSKKYDAVERQMSDNATRAELADAELATERARLDWLQEHALAQHSEGISISKLGKHYNGFPGSLRAAIDAAMKEETK